MIDSLDAELRDRLVGLAAAVPIRQRGALAAVATSGVGRGSTTRRLPLAGIVTALAILVVGTSLAGVLRIGPFAPGATRTAAAPSPGATSIEPSPAPLATDRDGDFELTLRANKAGYAPDEIIDVTASLTYLGGEPSVEIEHDSGGPISFGIRERVFDQIDLAPVSRLMCSRTTLERNAALLSPFKKSGGFSGDDPNADEFLAFMHDPVLRLPPGTWHIYAFSAAPCMGFGPRFSVSAEIAIEVGGEPQATMQASPAEP